MIKESEKVYFRRLNRNLVLEEILRVFRQKSRLEGLTQVELANRLGMDPGQLSRTLREPSNLKLDTISDLLLGMNAEFNFEVVPQSQPQAFDEFLGDFLSFSSAESSPSDSNIVSWPDAACGVESMSQASSRLDNWTISSQGYVEAATD